MKERERLALVLLSFGQIEGSRALSRGARGNPPPNIASGERVAQDGGKSKNKSLAFFIVFKISPLHLALVIPYRLGVLGNTVQRITKNRLTTIFGSFSWDYV